MIISQRGEKSLNIKQNKKETTGTINNNNATNANATTAFQSTQITSSQEQQQ